MIFDDQARKAIRGRLDSLCKQHNRGSTWLADHIAATVWPGKVLDKARRANLVAQIKRFMTEANPVEPGEPKRTRVRDSTVVYFAEFVKTLPAATRKVLAQEVADEIVLLSAHVYFRGARLPFIEPVASRHFANCRVIYHSKTHRLEFILPNGISRSVEIEHDIGDDLNRRFGNAKAALYKVLLADGSRYIRPDGADNTYPGQGSRVPLSFD